MSVDHLMRTTMRVATAIHEQLAGSHSAVPPELPVDHWNRCNDLVQLIRLAGRNRWDTALAKLNRDFQYELDQLSSQSHRLADRLRQSRGDRYRASAAEIFRDLFALPNEFAGFSWDLRSKSIAVLTEPIVLEHLELGRFEIRLYWRRLRDMAAGLYRVNALDPNPAARSTDITHPHVDCGVLCEGDARPAIRSALEQGRIFDFFTLVAGVLRTYNGSSPYVPIDDWHGAECADCGGSASGDERYSCSHCDSTLCGECVRSCASCEQWLCGRCAAECQGCEETACERCMERCRSCNKLYCDSCLENQACQTCNEDSENEAKEESKTADLETD